MTSQDTQIHNLYHREKLSLMRIAKRFDCRVQDVRDALAREDRPKLPIADYAAKFRGDQIKRSAGLSVERSGKALSVSHKQNTSLGHRKIPITLPKVSFLEETQ